MMNLNRALMHVYLIILCASGCSPAFIYVHQPNIAESYFSNKAQKAKRSAEKNPQNPNTLIAACSLMTMYHYGFTMEAADRIIEHNYALGKETFETAHLGFISAYAFGEAAPVNLWILKRKMCLFCIGRVQHWEVQYHQAGETQSGSFAFQ